MFTPSATTAAVVYDRGSGKGLTTSRCSLHNGSIFLGKHLLCLRNAPAIGPIQSDHPLAV